VLTHFVAALTQFLARIRREISFRGANFGVFSVQLFQAGLRVNFEFGQGYASEKNRTSILIKLNELAIFCVRSGKFMLFPTLSLAISLHNYRHGLGRRPVGPAALLARRAPGHNPCGLGPPYHEIMTRTHLLPILTEFLDAPV
jgi:hypothetical protein